MDNANLCQKPTATIARWTVAFLKAAGLVLIVVLSGCAKPATTWQTGSRDNFLGWYKLTKTERIIPVFKREGIYHSVCRGFEIPFKACHEALEWAFASSAMVGTRIGWDAASGTYYLAVTDSSANSSTDSRYGSGEKEPMTRVPRPSGLLLDVKARPPRTQDDFQGWYQPVWTPGWRVEIRKEKDRFVGQSYESDSSGVWKLAHDPFDLTPLPIPPGFSAFDPASNWLFIYNNSLQRFELSVGAITPAVIRMPLARVPTPTASECNKPAPVIGIPSWT